ncbi:MAG: zinc-ribbon domain-containing protein [Deltaproteobacteria bacterium]|nr:zinc-ribbon domain-containing protein [Deltaproteobacteria bacterium]
MEKKKGDMIIQCPKCKTKFSVSSELVAGYELPRFHCSRCDNVFDLDTKSELTIENRDIGLASEKRLSSVPSPAPLQSPAPAEPPPQATQVKTFMQEESEEQESLTAVPSQPQEPRSLQIPRAFDSTFTPAAPHEPRRQESIEQLPFSFSGGSDETYSEQDSFDLAQEQESSEMPFGISIGSNPKQDFTLVNPGTTPPLFSKEFDLPQAPHHSPEAAADMVPDFPGVGISIPDHLPSRYTPWRSFFTIATPMLVVLALLAGVSYYLVKSPTFAHAFINSISASAPKFPPAALHITNLRFKKIILDSGESVYAVVGKVRNNSNQAFKEVTLEGLAFGANGHLIAQSKVSAGATLVDARMKSFPVETLRELQAAPSGKNYELAPGKSQDFLVALLDAPKGTDPSKAAYFSARIHSVRN